MHPEWVYRCLYVLVCVYFWPFIHDSCAILNVIDDKTYSRYHATSSQSQIENYLFGHQYNNSRVILMFKSHIMQQTLNTKLRASLLCKYFESTSSCPFAKDKMHGIPYNTQISTHTHAWNTT